MRKWFLFALFFYSLSQNHESKKEKIFKIFKQEEKFIQKELRLLNIGILKLVCL